MERRIQVVKKFVKDLWVSVRQPKWGQNARQLVQLGWEKCLKVWSPTSFQGHTAVSHQVVRLLLHVFMHYLNTLFNQGQPPYSSIWHTVTNNKKFYSQMSAMAFVSMRVSRPFSLTSASTFTRTRVLYPSRMLFFMFSCPRFTQTWWINDFFYLKQVAYLVLCPWALIWFFVHWSLCNSRKTFHPGRVTIFRDSQLFIQNVNQDWFLPLNIL